ncbi:tRNA uridine-5-carboxymethylaminomethyl(34) synthesis GTPase MnmE [Candidatus Soleaferrea massiliensis]|uniref:tRNA uridine-5-carboxymethylaminomethyl(34) synthesis GTPase MnmE n=1 Tax=Candidatus Soleaferrea massiliensis TaxID=1470354 RepID=UPI00058EB6A5|nr:tRNA uridine-5-carboxymethylaminomethyl(34) synthesis GTPase MnmE [Candidatus Soleaferrea massiliensis]
MTGEQATIAAISTPMAAGGLGVVRISGPEALQIAARVFRPVGTRTIQNVDGYTGIFGRVFDRAGDIDEAVALVFHGPKSYTGEDVVELSCHGGLYLLQRLLRAILDAGAAPAGPGEFTKRAFLNGKLGLTQAEAVMDLISAQGKQASRSALAAHDGVLYQKIDAVKSRLITLGGHISAWIDYPEEDIEALEMDSLSQELRGMQVSLQKLLDSFEIGKLLREGIDTAIIGKPNVGKSTLMNLLAGEQKSIVTDIPGTTRDVVEDTVRLGDLVLRLADTAGIRTTDDPVEKQGVRLAQKRLESASLVLGVFDNADELTEHDIQLIERIKERPAVAVINKADLLKKLDIEYIKDHIQHIVMISASTGDGLEELIEAIREVLQLNHLDEQAAMLSTERQRNCTQRALQSIGEAIDALTTGMTLDAVDVCLEDAVSALLELTGERVTDVVVDEVFSHFCVGK